MNNAHAMAASLESRKNSQALLITAAFAGLLVLMMFLWSWTIPVIVPPPPDPGIMVELNMEDLATTTEDGGGGGGNPVEASGPAGVAPYSPPDPGTMDDAKDVDDDPTESSPPILKPDKPKPTATKLKENKSPVKTPKPIPQTPAPKPKAVIARGRTLTGNGNGGGVASTYDRAGGAGTGSGVGNGNGTGGGTGSGSGGGNGSGVGRGNGPRVIGDRRIVTSYAFEGNLDKATIYAEVKVSPDGVGQFIQFARGSSSTSSSYRNEIIQYLRKIRFDKSDHESTVTVQFNFRVDG